MKTCWKPSSYFSLPILRWGGRFVLIGVLALAGLPGRAVAVFNPEKDVAIVLQQGAVVVTVPSGVHLKKSFMEVRLASKAGKLKVGKLPPASGQDELQEEIYRGTVRVPITGEGLQGTVSLAVQYQPCTEGEGGNCFAPTTRTLAVKASEIPAAAPTPAAKVPLPAPVLLPGAPAAAPVPASEAPAPVQVASLPAPEAPAPPKSLFWALALVFLAGMGASLTPCVYPMIPITMAIIGAKGGGKAKGFLLSLLLVLGMAVTYTVLGVVAAKSGAAFGAFAQKPAFLIPVSVLFGVFALSLFGAFELALPQGLTEKLQGTGPRKGYLGAFLMGLVLGPLAAPCVGPIIGAVLVGIAQQGNVFQGGLQLFLFSMGMGVLFMVVGTFSAGLPRSGAWLTRFKQVMGLVVLGFAAWNVRLVVPVWVNSLLWMAVTLAAAAVFGVFENPEGLLAQARRGLAVVFLALAVLLGLRTVEGALDVTLLPAGATARKTEAAASPWISQDYEQALALARQENKLVLLDTYAEWCAQCKELDENTWPDRKVTAWIKDHAVAVRVDADKVRPDLAKRLAIRSFPTVVLLDAQGVEQRRSLGYLKPEAMLKFLSQSH